MKESHFSRAMDLSDGIFAYHLCGVMSAMHEAGSICPDPDAEALSYLQVYYPHVLLPEEKEEADENNSTNPLQWS